MRGEIPLMMLYAHSRLLDFPSGNLETCPKFFDMYDNECGLCKEYVLHKAF